MSKLFLISHDRVVNDGTFKHWVKKGIEENVVANIFASNLRYEKQPNSNKQELPNLTESFITPKEFSSNESSNSKNSTEEDSSSEIDFTTEIN
ncbi:17245_t:CDS:2 [Cetraspora pellucida]|uniref:17245_t:CDS:1 n=1 Tax=Cetraspora pellucida TaxID=1433469 RepID=A0ACA9MK87_9GLOM|nr:17245_t:CDS:2 [Cetraspora pellucida]